MSSATKQERTYLAGSHYHGYGRRPHFTQGFLLVVVFGLFAGTAPAGADENAGGISVSGSGSVQGKPSVVEMEATISGEGELANDASVKFRNTRKNAAAALEALKIPDLSIEFRGSSVAQAIDPQAQMRMMQGMGGDTGKAKVQVTEQLHLVLKNADKLEADKLLDTLFKIIDTSRDAGAVVGPPQPTNFYQMQIRAQGGSNNAIAEFKIPDITPWQDEAYKLAFADARAKAERLAQLSGVKLGRVLSVQDQGAPPAGPGANVYYALMMSEGAAGQPTTREASSEHFGEIPITVRVQVLFEIQK